MVVGICSLDGLTVDQVIVETGSVLYGTGHSSIFVAEVPEIHPNVGITKLYREKD